MRGGSEEMEGKIPLPTDNIYKFYALFGLLLLITCIGSFTYVYQTSTELLFEDIGTIATLAAKEDLSAEEINRKQLVQKRIDITVKNRETFNVVIGIATGLALSLLWFGFQKWHCELQPKLDRLLDLQIAKAERELKPPQRKPFRVHDRTSREI